MALGTGLWKVFWWVAKVDEGERDFRAFTNEIRDDIKLILLRLDPTLEESDHHKAPRGRRSAPVSTLRSGARAVTLLIDPPLAGAAPARR